jgi:hypothetical protein
MITVFLTIVIITGGFLLPTLLFPSLDSYSNRLVGLVSPTEDMVSAHIYEEQVTLYPWNSVDDAQVRSLTSYEMSTLYESGVANLLMSYQALLGRELELSYEAHVEKILSSFRYLEPLNSSLPACFALIDADIDGDQTPDIRCAVDLSGNLISWLIVNDTWSALELTAPIEVPLVESLQNEEEPGDADSEKSNSDQDEAEESNATENANNTEEPSGVLSEPLNPSDSQGAFLPLPEEEKIWQFLYVISREALKEGQQDVFVAFRQLELSYEDRFGYSFLSLIPTPPGYVEILPEIEPIPENIGFLSTGNYLLRVHTFSNGTMLILYINSDTQYCDGFILYSNTVPL